MSTQGKACPKGAVEAMINARTGDVVDVGFKQFNQERSTVYRLRDPSKMSRLVPRILLNNEHVDLSLRKHYDFRTYKSLETQAFLEVLSRLQTW